MVEIEILVDQLSIIRNPDYWWRFIQGGITEISEGDFDLIQSAAFEMIILPETQISQRLLIHF